MPAAHVVTAGTATPGGQSLLLPLRWAKRAIRDRGWSVTFGSREVTVPPCDTVVVDSKAVRDLWAKGAPAAVAAVDHLRGVADRLVFFDTGDSSGFVLAEVLPVVDVYCKGQLLRDRDAYARPMYGGRSHADHYHRTEGVIDEDPLWSRAVTDATLRSKLRVGWSMALARHDLFGPIAARGAPWSMIAAALPVRVSGRPGGTREVPVSARMATRYGRPSIAHQRLRVIEKLAGRADSSRVARRVYRRELRRAVVAVSPFGWGEISTKDFEVFLSGATLLKPDMSHLDTWPELYEDSATYVAHRWDLTDLLERVEGLLADLGLASAIAAEGQRRYLAAVSDRDAFADRVVSILRS